MIEAGCGANREFGAAERFGAQRTVHRVDAHAAGGADDELVGGRIADQRRGRGVCPNE